jgi:hypothetical protein
MNRGAGDGHAKEGNDALDALDEMGPMKKKKLKSIVYAAAQQTLDNR